MRIPVWLALAVAAFVVIFGVYRIHLGFTQSAEHEAEAKKRGGLYGMGKRFHLFVGVVYVLMGAALTAMAFGWQPLGDMVGPSTEAPANTVPAGAIPLEQQPAKK